MSTADPIAAARAKRLSRQGQPKYLIWAIITGALTLVAALSAGLGAGLMFDLLRSGLVNDFAASSDPLETSFLGLATLPVLLICGILGLIIAGSATSLLLDQYRGGEKRPVLLAPLIAWMVAAGVTLDTRTWVAPIEVGRTVDPYFPQESDTWGFGTWFLYRANIWLPALVVVIALLVTLYAIRRNRRLRAQIAVRNRLLTEGRKVTGQITDVSIRTTQNDQGQRSVAGADVVIKFADLQGTERWIKRQLHGRSNIPTLRTAVVLFDPMRPDDEESIFVAFVPDPLPGDWIGTLG